MLKFLDTFNTALFIFFTVAYLYMVMYAAIGLLKRGPKVKRKAKKLHKYAAVICARNEQEVIAHLIKTLKDQKYPRGLLDIYVVADNCTDYTAKVAAEAGANVFERFDTNQVGKGYALDYFFQKMLQEPEYASKGYEGYFIFDADNLADPNFVREMNRVFDQGYQALTSYRNSKNFGTNWITAGYSINFIREARMVNNPRMRLRTGCAISGTGFLVSHELIRKKGGWKYFLLTEDIQFSADCAVSGDLIGYCADAMVYDEQPETFRQSWTQRLRWAKGFYQTMGRYGWKLFKGIFCFGENATSCYDMFMTIAPATLLTVLALIVNGMTLILCLINPPYMAYRIIRTTVEALFNTAVNFYIVMFIYGALTIVSEWKRIRAKWYKKIAYTFTFPLFMLSYVPIGVAALVTKVQWRPIRHSVSKTLEEII
ncbi:MAG: glycosyltransferase family 2 protein [Christensenellales bacterium]|jgi:cellulose synthase/poly-beta-1,6-N-acetylglucosamine synthase-like glycosyltransferase